MPHRKTNLQRRSTITVHADLITIIYNCLHKRWYTNVPLVDNEMLLVIVLSKTALGSEFRNI